MISSRAALLYDQIKSAVAYVEVRKPDGGLGIGSAFHLGGGYFATAKHVIDGNQILRLGRDDLSLITSIGEGGYPLRRTRYPTFTHPPSAVFSHADPQVDAAVIQLSGHIEQCGNAADLQPVVRLGRHIQHLSPGELLMTEVLVLGYPQVPKADCASLVAVPGLVSTVIRHQVGARRHLIVSGMPRGGFSGGPVFAYRLRNPAEREVNPNDGTVIGIVVDSLTTADTSGNPLPEQLGFMSALSIDAVAEIIREHRLPVAEA